MITIISQKHVQVLMEDEGSEITRMLLDEEGHFYVCGDCKMAEEVQQKLKTVIKIHAKMSDQEVEEFILDLMVRLIVCILYSNRGVFLNSYLVDAKYQLY